VLAKTRALCKLETHFMSLLTSTLNLNDKAVQLLEAAGCADAAAIAAMDVNALRKRLAAANEQRKLYKKLPSNKQLEQWITAARKESGAASEEPVAVEETQAPEPDTEAEPPTEEAEPELVNFEFDPDVLEMIAMSPVALPLPGKLLAAKKVPVQEIPAAVLLTAARGDVSMRVGTKAPEKPVESTIIKNPVAQGNYVNTISFGVKKEEVNRSRIRSTQEFLDPNAKPQTIDHKARAAERMQILRAALPETNRGVDPSSRRYIRGVLHSHPNQVWWGALFTLACHFFIPTGIFAAFALLLKDNGSATFQWVPSWFLAFPLGVFFFGALYLIISYGCTCRICGQKCFVPRNCLKNKKAHHVPVLGYVFAVALHIVLFRWFRCSFCGTPVRLKQ
jgi:hypothetical protein